LRAARSSRVRRLLGLASNATAAFAKLIQVVFVATYDLYTNDPDF
jgi:hypothetical protein